MGLVICKTKDQILKNFQIRFEVFNKEQNVPYELDMDLAEFNGEMFLYTDESEENYVACARIIYEKDRIHLGRVAVLKEYRNQGYATKMVLAIERIVKTMGIKEIYVEAQMSAKAFYEKLGYQSYGDIFMDANMPHVYMRKYV